LRIKTRRLRIETDRHLMTECGYTNKAVISRPDGVTSDRLYESMNIMGVTGIIPAHQSSPPGVGSYRGLKKLMRKNIFKTYPLLPYKFKDGNWDYQ